MIDQGDGTRRTIDELVTLHAIEPELHEVYTEGRTDAGVIEWFLRGHGVRAAVYAVSDRVEIDFDVRARGVQFGEKGKVVAVACNLAELEADGGFTCIADADYWYTLDQPPTAAATVLLTDYTDLNMYCFNEEVLQQFLLVCIRASFQVSARRILSAITPLLISLFVLRWLLQKEVSNLELVAKIERRAKVEGASMTLDVERLLRDSASAWNDPTIRRADLARIVSELQTVLDGLPSGDPRRWINGHDFVRFLCHYLEKVHPGIFGDDRKHMKDPGTAKLALLGCLDHQALATEGLFRRLLERTGGKKERQDFQLSPRVSPESLEPTKIDS